VFQINSLIPLGLTLGLVSLGTWLFYKFGICPLLNIIDENYKERIKEAKR